MDTAIQLRPQSLDDADRISDSLKGCALLPPQLRERPAIYLMCHTAAELGLSIAQAVRGIHIINGKPVVSADLMAGLCLSRRDVCKYFRYISESPEGVTYETWRVGDDSPRQASFTKLEAQAAGLLGKNDSNWAKYPMDMLHARAKARLARRVYPDLIFGIVSREEMDDGAVMDMVETAAGVYTAPPPAEKQPKAKADTDKRKTLTPEAADRAARASGAQGVEAQIEYWTDMIGTTKNLDELDAMRPELRKLPKGRVREALLHAYTAHEAFLKSNANVIDAEVIEREPGEEG